jgi:hypothetical protein
MIKGAVDAPELMRTQDNPERPPMQYPYSNSYCALKEMTAARSQRRAELECKVDRFLNRAAQEGDARPPEDLEFIK